jgi:hypothetical protein
MASATVWSRSNQSGNQRIHAEFIVGALVNFLRKLHKVEPIQGVSP